MQSLPNANVMNISESIAKKGLHVFLVKHKVFEEIIFSNTQGSTVIDFCGVDK